MTSSTLLRILAVLLASLATRPVYGRLGETEPQAQARYGAPAEGLVGGDEKPLLPGAIERAYNFEGWRVRAAFVNGATVRIQYVHIENNAPKKLDEAQIKTLLEAEKANFTWHEEKSKQVGYAKEIEKLVKSVANINKWERSDHAKAELVVGIALQFETHDADEIEKRLARTLPKQPGQPGASGAKVPKF